MYAEGRLQAWIDTSRTFKGVESIPEAIDHMLQGGHVGKVVVQI